MNFSTRAPKRFMEILVMSLSNLTSISEEIFYRKRSLGAPEGQTSNFSRHELNFNLGRLNLESTKV